MHDGWAAGGICSGFVPDRNKLCELAEQYDGVLVIFENISDELTMP